MSPAPSANFIIRSFQPADGKSCQHLYYDGLVGGSIAENDSGLDIEDIHAAYNSIPGNHFWVAVNRENHVVGMIGVMMNEMVAEIRRLRVRGDHRRRGIGSALLEQALKFCKENHCLKVTLDTFVEREAAIKLFEKFSFRHARTKSINEKELLYFYLDLYSTGQKEQPQ